MKVWPLMFLLAALLLAAPPYLAHAKGEEIDDLMEMSLEDLLELETAGRGDVGSFGYRLEESGAKVSIHGYATTEYLKEENKPGTFDNHYFNLFVTGKLTDRVVAEIQLEYEHGGTEIQARYAQVDIRVFPWLIVRTGKFLIPAGPFNEFLYPEYILKTIQRPYALREIVPSSWADVGVQLRGTVNAGDVKPFYAFYVVNGLEENPDPAKTSFRDMRGAGGHRDKNDHNKAVGGHLGLSALGFEGGLSHYTGAYSADGMLDLNISGLDLAYSGSNFTVRGELHQAEQDVTGGTNEKDGFYILASYVLVSKYEPVLQYDMLEETFVGAATREKERITLGFNVHITDLVVWKVNYEMVDITTGGAETSADVIGTQLAMGF